MKRNNEKQRDNDVLSTGFYGPHDCTFAEAIEALKEAEKEALKEVEPGGNMDRLPEYEVVELRIQENSNSGYCTIHVTYQETDEAYKKRLKREKSFVKELKQRELEKEREEYERLKKKFEEA